MLDRVEIPEDRISHNEAHLWKIFHVNTSGHFIFVLVNNKKSTFNLTVLVNVEKMSIMFEMFESAYKII